MSHEPSDSRSADGRAPSVVRLAAGLVIIAAVMLPAAACSGARPSASTTSASASASALAYSACMRSHGVVKFPDPDSNGQLPKTGAQQLGVSSAELTAAQTACQSLYPAGPLGQQAQECMATNNCPPAVVQQMLTDLRSFAQCMRTHGVPNWPDPTIDAQGRPTFDFSAAGIDAHQPQIEAAQGTCDQLTGVS